MNTFKQYLESGDDRFARNFPQKAKEWQLLAISLTRLSKTERLKRKLLNRTKGLSKKWLQLTT